MIGTHEAIYSFSGVNWQHFRKRIKPNVGNPSARMTGRCLKSSKNKIFLRIRISPGVDVMIKIFGQKIGVFLEKLCYDQFLQKLAVYRVKTPILSAIIFSKSLQRSREFYSK
jgi:hypothetical protein